MERGNGSFFPTDRRCRVIATELGFPVTLLKG